MDEFTSRRVVKDLDFVKKTLANMDKTLALQQQSLDVHIKRTDLLEKKLEPVEEHVAAVNTVLKILSWLGGAGLLVLIVQYFLK